MMNPIMLLIVPLIAVIIWFLLAFAYKPLGRFAFKIWEDAMDEIKEDNKEEKENK